MNIKLILDSRMYKISPIEMRRRFKNLIMSLNEVSFLHSIIDIPLEFLIHTQFAEHETFCSAQIVLCGTLDDSQAAVSCEGNEEIATAAIECDCDKMIYDFVNALNIVSYGAFPFNGATILCNSHSCSVSGVLNYFCDFCELYGDIADFPKCELDFLSVWKWLGQQTHFFDGMSQSSIDRALNAYSHTFCNDSYSAFFYSMVSLEALYKLEYKNIQYQIRENSYKFLAPKYSKNKYKQLFNSIYNFRSQFLHGQLDFPSRQMINMSTDEMDTFDEKYMEEMRLVLAILISTFQKLIMHNLTSIKPLLKIAKSK